jgi:membrane-bound ClpP family serine protease
MTLGVIIAIILIGLVLIFLEIFLIPGTTLFGLVGGVALVIGVVLIYGTYGSYYGNIATASTIVLLGVAVVAGFKVIQSNRLAMKAEIKSKVNELEKHLFNTGDKGIAVTELRPNGKAIFNDNKTDVYTFGEYIKRDTEIEIIKIDHNKIFVKPFKS